MPSICQQLQAAYQALKSKKQEFYLAYEKACATDSAEDTREARKLMKELKEKRNVLEKMLWPFKELERMHLQEQYEFHEKTFKDLGIVEDIGNGQMGINAINGEKYAFPSFGEVCVAMRQNKEILKTKIEQGFRELLIAPFGMKLDDLIEKYKQTILKHHREGKLFATKENPSDPDELLELDESEPLLAWSDYQNADKAGELKYYPKKFSNKHKGKTKQEILEKQGKTKGAGFNIIFIEDMPIIPRKNPKIKGGRTQIDTHGSSIKKYIKAGETIPSLSEYLQAINTEPIYIHEIGMTPEDQLIYALLYLEKYNQVIDNYLGKGSISHQIGAYFAVSGSVPDACWVRGYRQAYLYGYDPGSRNGFCGVRPAVRVKLEI